MKSHDAVIICASLTILKGFKEKPDYFSNGTRFCIDAMKEYGVKRLVILSAHGVGNSYHAASWFQRTFMICMLIKYPYLDHDVQEQMVRESGLDFVIAHPTRLTDSKATDKYAGRTSIGAGDNLTGRRGQFSSGVVRVTSVRREGRRTRRVSQ